ncbi:hypothetical protein [Candidatus Electronema sp. PJ]|uniref:hypothetical protein n=1 Tax=Candidatus Electronema sp. PJ TaxID=3401572 RepID=UPI003AA91D17
MMSKKRKALGKLWSETTAIMPDSPFSVEKILLSTAKANPWRLDQQIQAAGKKKQATASTLFSDMKSMFLLDVAGRRKYHKGFPISIVPIRLFFSFSILLN